MGTFKKIMQLTAAIVESTEQRERAVADLVSDLEWMDVPVLRMSPSYLPEGADPGDTFHIVEQIEEATGYQRFYTADPKKHGSCWCSKPINSGPHYQPGQRRGNRLGYIYRGECIFIGCLNGKAHLVPRLNESMKETT